MMRLVLLSDIHANLTALQAVLKDIESIGEVDSFALLGDFVNYGPRPNEAIKIAKDNPEFEFGTTARIEVRPIKVKEESINYIYPNKAG